MAQPTIAELPGPIRLLGTNRESATGCESTNDPKAPIPSQNDLWRPFGVRAAFCTRCVARNQKLCSQTLWLVHLLIRRVFNGEVRHAT
jgi:hypothetical protein